MWVQRSDKPTVPLWLILFFPLYIFSISCKIDGVLNFVQQFIVHQMFCIALGQCYATNAVQLSLDPLTVEDKERGEGWKHRQGALIKMRTNWIGRDDTHHHSSRRWTSPIDGHRCRCPKHPREWQWVLCWWLESNSLALHKQWQSCWGFDEMLDSCCWQWMIPL